MHASIPTTYVSLIFVYSFLFSHFFLVLPLLLSFLLVLVLHLLFTATTFYTICHGGIYHFYPLTIFGSLQVSFRDCPLACQLLRHYHCYECVCCTTPHLPLNCFGSLQVSFRDYPLACRLLKHYHCSKCVCCTTPHSQTKLLVLFLTSLCFSQPLSR